MRERKSGIGVGMASVLMIVMVLAFTTFGILSLVSARADSELSRKSKALAASWYAAEGRMQEQLAELDMALKAGEDRFAQDGTLELTEPAGEGRVLQVSLEKTDENAENRYKIVKYELVNTNEWNPDSGFEVWDGGQ